MRQLNYSVGKLIGMALVSLLVAPITLFIPMDEQIASGQTRGLLATLFYEIGPAGRWTLAMAIIGTLAFISLRSIAILFTDKIALRADETGVFFRTFRKCCQIGWDDVLSIDKRERVIRGSTSEWIYISARIGSGEGSWRVYQNMLDADDVQVMDWISEARRLRTNSRIPAVNVSPPEIGRGFGRRRSSVIS